MTLEEITQKINQLSTEHGGKIGSTIKFRFQDDTVIFLDDSVSPPTVSNQDDDAACTVKISQENLIRLMDGEMNAMGAYMTGKLKIEGDMGIAMKLANIF